MFLTLGRELRLGLVPVLALSRVVSDRMVTMSFDCDLTLSQVVKVKV